MGCLEEMSIVKEWVRSTLLTAGLLLTTVTALSGQTVEGRVLDQESETPVGGAIVALVDEDGEERTRTLADSIGRFRIEPPEPGNFYLVAERFGYYETRSPLIAFHTEGRAELELMMIPQPVGLEGLEVSVEEMAEQELGLLGLTPAQLGNRWIDRDEIDAIAVKRDMGVILERTAQAGIQVLRSENLTMGSDDIGLCISQQRARTGAGRGRCSLVVLDGVPVSGVQAQGLDPTAIESIAILDPVQATTLYGTRGGGGAVLVWTRRGG